MQHYVSSIDDGNAKKMGVCIEVFMDTHRPLKGEALSVRPRLAGKGIIVKLEGGCSVGHADGVLVEGRGEKKEKEKRRRVVSPCRRIGGRLEPEHLGGGGGTCGSLFSSRQRYRGIPKKRG